MKARILKFLDLTSDLDNLDQIHATIESGVIFRGTNLWILIFAIVVASVGLNMNSTAVIIGAMLISPLMGPINGMGYSIATYDFVLFRRSLKNFSFAVAASLCASTVYFAITPLSQAHSELLARTSPTIYDVLIALFGGLAGIVAISSRHKGNVIPGVAIATALMPPLCTAGFGLATLQMNYFFGAFYLFVINTVFIGISSVLFSQILNFPIRTIVEPARKRQVNRLISVVIAITLVPSVYFGYLLVDKERFEQRARAFVAEAGIISGSYLLKHDLSPSEKSVRLVYAGQPLTENAKERIANVAARHDIDGSKLIFEEAISFSDVSANINKVDNELREELNRLALLLRTNQRELDSLQARPVEGKRMLNELRAFYPGISSLSFSRTTVFGEGDSTDVSVVIVSASKALRLADQAKVRQWVRNRVSPDSAQTVFIIN